MILALQTADITTRLWLLPDNATQPNNPVLTWESGRTLSDELLSKIMATLKQNSFTINQLSGLIIFSGPGSFTSLRIGHSIGNALADSLNIPIVGAVGVNWIQTGLLRIKTARPGHPALPVYGSEAHITRPKVD